jgi:hypothetical protein
VDAYDQVEEEMVQEREREIMQRQQLNTQGPQAGGDDYESDKEEGSPNDDGSFEHHQMRSEVRLR